MFFTFIFFISLFVINNVKAVDVVNFEKIFMNATSLKIIYVSDDFITTGTTSGNDVFTDDTALVGGNGTACDGTNNTNYLYARIDTDETPGYFTKKD